MICNRRYSLLTLLALLISIVMEGCSQDEIVTLSNGTLRLSIGQSASVDVTRATPAQLGKPLVEKFSLKVVKNENVHYEGGFVDELELRVGTYDVKACYGEDVAIGKDAPYYEGSATALIEKDASTTVTIPCRVANALVSVNFGRDEEERARFDKFYSHYGLMVQVGSYSLAITEEEKNTSIYFPAGSKPTLYFYGVLRESEQTVSCELQSDYLPVTYEAAEHAIVTLTLPEGEVEANISKVNVEMVTVEETIPLSWFPAPTATAQHHYDNTGMLVGTDLQFVHSYPNPNLQWRVVVTNAADEEVRRTEGSGELFSAYDSSSDYLYLPSGSYLATYYLIDGDTAEEVGRRTFTIGSPELKITLGGYTSYSKYLEGNVDAANACDRGSVYDISVALNVSEALLAKYPYTFTFQYASMDVENVTPKKNRFYRDVLANQAPSFEPYRLKADATFDGASASNTMGFYITGLPVSYAPPSTANGWSKASGDVSFNSGEARLDNGSIANARLAIPSQVAVVMDYNVKIRAAATLLSTTTFTISLGGTELLSQTQRGNFFSESSKTYSGSKDYTSTSQTTTIECKSSNSYTNVNSISLKYKK